jgi:hypothetical protein
VAHATVENLELHVVRPQLSPIDLERSERRCWALGRVGFGGWHVDYWRKLVLIQDHSKFVGGTFNFSGILCGRVGAFHKVPSKPVDTVD